MLALPDTGPAPASFKCTECTVPATLHEHAWLIDIGSASACLTDTEARSLPLCINMRGCLILAKRLPAQMAEAPACLEGTECAVPSIFHELPSHYGMAAMVKASTLTASVRNAADAC